MTSTRLCPIMPFLSKNPQEAGAELCSLHLQKRQKVKNGVIDFIWVGR